MSLGPTGPSGGGGATEFTELIDCPATIVADTLLGGNSAANALDFIDWLTLDTTYHTLYANSAVPDPDSNGAAFAATADNGTTFAQIGAVPGGASVAANVNGAGLTISASAAEATMFLFGVPFKMSGFDVVASSLTGAMTVDGVSYAITKAVQVKIGSDTYFWPLFGPVVP